LTQAAALYRGEFGTDLYLNDCPEFEIWLLREREYWSQQITKILTTLVTHFATYGQYEDGLHFARRLLAIEPWREDGHRYLMRLLALSGQRNAALMQFESCRKVLAEELDVEPSPETVALYEQIKAQVEEFALPAPLNLPPDPPAVSPPIYNFPTQITPFVGREVELAQISAHLRQPGCRLLTLIGPGGVGKTRLALQAAYQQLDSLQGAPRFKDGIYFISLVGVDRVEELLPTLRDEVDLPDLADQTPLQQLLAFLENKSLLLILDNFEQITAGAGLLTDLLAQAPQLKLLVTSQKRLNTQAEWLFTVRGLDYPPASETEEAEQESSYSAVELFVQNARRVRPDFLPSAGDMSWIGRICRLVTGLPLAIELAAHWTRLISCHDLAQELEYSSDLLSTSLRDVPGRHRSMKTVLDYSWQLLAGRERVALQNLSLFKGGFQREMAERVAGVSLDILSSLVDRGLLAWEAISTRPQAQQGRYQTHELLRRYAAAKLEESGGPQATAIYRTYTFCYTNFLQQRVQQLKQQFRPELLSEIKVEKENILTAWRWIIAHGYTAELEEFEANLFYLYDTQGWFREGELLFAAAVSAVEAWDSRRWLAATPLNPPAGPPPAPLRQAQDAAPLRGGGREGSSSAATPALPTPAAGTLRGGGGEGSSLKNSGGHHSELLPYQLSLKSTLWLRQAHFAKAAGDYSTALSLVQHAIRAARQARDPMKEAWGYLKWGRILERQGSYEGACVRLEQALTVARRWEQEDLEAESLHGLARSYWGQGSYNRACAYLGEALTLFRNQRNRRQEAAVLADLGAVNIDLSDYATSRDYLELAYALYQSLGDRQGTIRAACYLGRVCSLLGDYEAGRAYGQHGLELSRKLGARAEEASALKILGLLYHRQGDNETALNFLQQAAALHLELGARNDEGYSLTYLGYTLEALGDIKLATEAYSRALQVRHALKQPQRAIDTLAGLARLELAQGNAAGAMDYLQEIWGWLKDNDLQGIEDPSRVYSTCLQILSQVDPKTMGGAGPMQMVLTEICSNLQDQVERLYHQSLPSYTN
jgi:predicted ATPase